MNRPVGVALNTRTLAFLFLGAALSSCAPHHLQSPVVPADASCVGGWVDQATGLCWQPEAREYPLVWSAAGDYCADLSLGGHVDWRLPTVDELRTLVRECPTTEHGGSCRVTDGSPLRDWSMGECLGCAHLQGSGEGGAYWDSAMVGPTSYGFWSSSEVVDRLGESWSISSEGAFLVREAQSASDHHVRCVRDRPRTSPAAPEADVLDGERPQSPAQRALAARR